MVEVDWQLQHHRGSVRNKESQDSPQNLLNQNLHFNVIPKGCEKLEKL